MWFFSRQLWSGELPLRVDDFLNFPAGGSLWVADPLNALLLAPLIPLLGVPVAYTLLVWFHVVFSGVMAYRLGERISGKASVGWVASLAYAESPLLICHIHNGASEAIAGGWLAWSLLATWELAENPTSSRGKVVEAGLAAALCAVAQWYAGVCAFAWLAINLLRRWRALGAAMALAALLVLPVAVLAQRTSTAADNVVGIKTEKEVNVVRRTIGPTDPRVWVMPGDFRSPDFRKYSKYAEEYIHSSYLGWVVLVGAALAGWGPGRRRLWLAVAAAALLSLGPVLVIDGQAVIVARRLAIPMPYFLVEKLPGFSSLSLLYRFNQLTVLGLAVLAGMGWSRYRYGWLAGALMIAESRFVSPMAGNLGKTDATIPAVFEVLRDAPEGAVMNYPVAGGRAYLYEQTVHGKPVAGSLNFPNNKASLQVWKALLSNSTQSPEAFRQAAAREAREQGVRYLVVHIDPMVRPDMHDRAERAVKDNMTPLTEADGIRIYQLY